MTDTFESTICAEAVRFINSEAFKALSETTISSDKLTRIHLIDGFRVVVSLESSRWCNHTPTYSVRNTRDDTHASYFDAFSSICINPQAIEDFVYSSVTLRKQYNETLQAEENKDKRKCIITRITDHFKTYFA